MSQRAETVQQFPRAALRPWYATHGRHNLPWRLTRDPYAVLVSEVMLQQTQVSRVLPAWEAWMQRWPTVADLANAGAPEVLRAWTGMGYNRRALNLHRAAVIVASSDPGSVPVDVNGLRALPGVGAYTAAAVASFAGEARVAVLDTNVSRVIARHCLGAADQHEVRPEAVAEAAGRLLPRDGAGTRDHNLALMDLGALVCTGRSPACEACPLRATCAWRARGCPPGTRTRRPSAAFETTARFARGRIVEALRAGPHHEASLRALLPPPHAARLDQYLAALAREGLVSPTREADGAALWHLGQTRRQAARSQQ